jgi:hypothetical protein
MKMYWGLEIYIHAFLISMLRHVNSQLHVHVAFIVVKWLYSPIRALASPYGVS